MKQKISSEDDSDSSDDNSCIYDDSKVFSSGDDDSEEEDDGGGDKGCSWISQCRSNWRNIVVVVCLWSAYLLCNVAYSTINPFFPQVVSGI